MTRQVITIDKIKKCHVATGENAGWLNWESGTAYEAGTLVAYENTLWCSIVPILATDTETPLEAPTKWAIVPTLLS